MKSPGTLLLSRSDVAALLNLAECIEAVEQAFKAHAEGRSLPPGVLGVHAKDGGFHIKAAGLELSRSYFAAKVNGNFMHNRERFGLPGIQGVIVLCDAEKGTPLAVLDSMEITILRTGAATGAAAKYLARADATTSTICGCGNQGRVSLRALARVRGITRVFAFDSNDEQAARYAEELSNELELEITAVRDLAEAFGKSDIIITCTPSQQAFLMRSAVAPGTFIAAVGADNEVKQELDPHLLAHSKVVVDSLAQCALIGDLKLALQRGLITTADVHAELGEVIAGRRPGRETPEEIIVFDSTGTALQDVAAAALVYERAVQTGRGVTFHFED
jgi:alanine dehydrogenase